MPLALRWVLSRSIEIVVNVWFILVVIMGSVVLGMDWLHLGGPFAAVLGAVSSIVCLRLLRRPAWLTRWGGDLDLTPGQQRRRAIGGFSAIGVVGVLYGLFLFRDAARYSDSSSRLIGIGVAASGLALVGGSAFAFFRKPR
jgi:hypothetical protein